MPKCVLNRAKELLCELEQGEVNITFTNDSVSNVVNEDTIHNKNNTQYNNIDNKDIIKKDNTVEEITEVNILKRSVEVTNIDEITVNEQLDLFGSANNDVISELKQADLINMTPFKALELLYTLQQKIKQ